MDSYKIGQIIPHELIGLKFECEKCKKFFKPDWLKPLGFPLIAGISKVQENMYFQRITLNMECPKCRAITAIYLPRAQLKHTVNFYGDEAERKLDKARGDLFTCSVFGISPVWQKEFETGRS